MHAIILPKTFRLAVTLILATVTSFPSFAQAQAQQESPQQRRGGGGGFRGGGATRGIYKAQISPHWFHNNTQFWYRNDLKGGVKEFIMVDAEKGARAPAFDHKKLAEALSKVADKEFKADHLPFEEIEFVDDGKAVKFSAVEKTWKCDLSHYECSEIKGSDSKALNMPLKLKQSPTDAEMARVDAEFADEQASLEEDNQSPAPQQQQGQGRGQRRGGFGGGQFGRGPQKSPDGKWTALIKEENVFLWSEDDGKEYRLTEDGTTNNAYGRIDWAKDSKTFISWKIEPGDRTEVYLIQSSPAGGGKAKLETRNYPQAGDKFTAYELNLFDVESRKQIKPKVDRVDFGSPAPRWSKDGYHFTYEKEDRGHQRFRVIDVDTHTGAVRNVVDEQTKTFIWTAHTDSFRGQLRITTYLDQGEELIYESEQDGWRHLYLYDLKEGKLKNQITKGQWVVRGVDEIDQDKRQIRLQLSGIYPGQDPYYVHYARVNFDGSGLVFLTEGNGDHSVAYSPDNKFIIDTYSRLDTPPTHELRRVSDGKLVCQLEEADIAELKAGGWMPLEPFVAKGRDGKTDIYGYIERPQNFDPNKKYPILEDIYAGPQGTPATMVPKAFSAAGRHGSYTSNGFIVVKIDAMGMPNRSKEFHDVCWHNIKDAGFPDRIAWMKAAAEKYPYMDVTRVGIFGTSAGGQNAAAAALFHPEFYKAAVANCGCHDNRIDKASWNEQWMGYMPADKIWSKDKDNWFSENSNIDNAWRLESKLFLIVGENDRNVPPESTLRFVDELIKARKDFEMLVVPGADHGAGSPITARRTQDFFVHHLLHQEPPDRNSKGG